MERRFAIIETRQEIALSTNFDWPAIPVRTYDWSAVDANTYDADYDYCYGSYVRKSPRGHGATEIEAIDSLIDSILEAA